MRSDSTRVRALPVLARAQVQQRKKGAHGGNSVSPVLNGAFML